MWPCDQKWPVGCISDLNLSILKVRIRSMRKRKAEIISFSLILIFRIIRFGWSSAQTIISLKTPLPLWKCKCIHTNNNTVLHWEFIFINLQTPREPRFWFVVCSNQNEEYILSRKTVFQTNPRYKSRSRLERRILFLFFGPRRTGLWSARTRIRKSFENLK